MKLLVLLTLSIISIAGGFSLFGKLSPGLRVRFGIGIIDHTVFFDIPRHVTEVVEDGWVNIEQSNNSYMPSLDMYCPPSDYTFCTMYNKLGYIAGLQIAIAMNNLTDTPMNLNSLGFRNWSAPATTDLPAQGYYINQQFFMSEETLKLSAEDLKALQANNATLYEDGIWVPYYNQSLIRIDHLRSNIDSTFKKQSCIPAMGRHYYYNLTTEATCDTLYPWFTLFQDDDLIGSGFSVFGTYNNDYTGKRKWFEHPPEIVVRAFAPYGPKCFYELAGAKKIATLHIYYVDKPLEVTCIAN